MLPISAKSFEALRADIAQIESITIAVKDSDSIDPYDLQSNIIALATSVQLLASCVDLLARELRK